MCLINALYYIYVFRKKLHNELTNYWNHQHENIQMHNSGKALHTICNYFANTDDYYYYYYAINEDKLASSNEKFKSSRVDFLVS